MTAGSSRTAPGGRDLRVDFLRGFALVVIFVNHMPGNPWYWYTPSRFGASDAAEIFVFLSGYAAALAYGPSFGRAGIALGSAAVMFRCAQIYVAHLALFLLVGALFASALAFGATTFDAQFDGLRYFFDRTWDALPALVGLRYVPNYIDILPMYLVIMLWLPLVVLLSRIHLLLALAFPPLLYLAAWAFGWELSADPLSGRNWFFNPFFWQLLFFSGFAFGSGWLAVPRWRRTLGAVCVGYVLLCVPLENVFVQRQLPWFSQLREQLAPVLDKSHLGLLRFAHFLALAYLFAHLTSTRRQWLDNAAARAVISLGQQSLPVFMLGTVLSFAGGIALGLVGVDLLDSAAINLAGILAMLGLARLLRWLDGKPWMRAAEPRRRSWPLLAVGRGAMAFALLAVTIAPWSILERTESPAFGTAPAEMEPIDEPAMPSLISAELSYEDDTEVVDTDTL